MKLGFAQAPAADEQLTHAGTFPAIVRPEAQPNFEGRGNRISHVSAKLFAAARLGLRLSIGTPTGSRLARGIDSDTMTANEPERKTESSRPRIPASRDRPTSQEMSDTAANMKRVISLPVLFLVLAGMLSFARPAHASVRIGTGNAGLLGGDLTDPEDDIVGKASCAGDLPEDQLKPSKGNWVKMKSAPNSPPGTAPHQRHPYQSWQNSPTCAIFLNKPEKIKWYVGFKDGGNGGPTDKAPYYAAVQLAKPVLLTHFTITTAADMPGRDPKVWAIQGSNTGKDKDWTDIYKCNAKDRNGTALRAKPRNETNLYTSFTSDNMSKAVKLSAADVKKIKTKLKSQEIATADFAPQTKAYTWFRIVVYSCFNPNTMNVRDFNRPSGFALGQLELFGVPGVADVKGGTTEAVKPPSYDPPFIISYWCGPPPAQTTLARYREIADCGFTVAMPPINSKNDVKTNLKILDLCKAVGIKAVIADARMPLSAKPPERQKALDAIIATYSSHPALLGYYIVDEPSSKAFPALAAINQYLLKADPKHLPYVNLFPNYANAKQLGNNSYEQHVSQYIATVKPALVSWDHYKQMLGDESFYWRNLETVRWFCLKARVPLIQIICSLPHFGYRDPSEADLRWQVYTSLAYGSRGILYFTYWDVPQLRQGPAIINKEGKRDKKYDYVRRINNRIKALGPTLVRLTSTGVYCTDPLPRGTRKLAADAPVKTAEGGPMVIGCFKDPDRRQYILVTNRSFRKKLRAKLTMDAKTASASEISQKTGKLLRPTVLAQNTLEVSLAAGEGRLFLLTQKPNRLTQ